MIPIEGGKTCELFIIDLWFVKSKSIHVAVVFVTLVGSFIIFF